MTGDTIADYLNVTVPLGFIDEARAELRPVLDMSGVSELSEDLFSLPSKGGTFKITKRGKVGIFSASGGYLAALRRGGLLDHYLAALSAFPHRVSMLHVTQDYVVDDVPQIIQVIKKMGHAGMLSLTRKKIRPDQVKAILSVDPSCGKETGTVYLGHKQNADVWAKVYDKGYERRVKGFDDPGNVVRVEIAVQSDVGATLRDVASPSALFHRFACESLVVAPDGVPEWVAFGEGYVPSMQLYDPTILQRLESILDTSLDVARLVRLARSEFGDGAFDALMPLLRARCRLRSEL